jgi:hypothetical protein
MRASGVCGSTAGGRRWAQATGSAACAPHRTAPGSVPRRVLDQVVVEHELLVDVHSCVTAYGQSDCCRPRDPWACRSGHVAATRVAPQGPAAGTGSRAADRIPGRGRFEGAALGCELEQFRLAARGRHRAPIARDRRDNLPGPRELPPRRRRRPGPREAASSGGALPYSPDSAATLTRRAPSLPIAEARRSSSRR